jgi:hypothetical protein
MSIREYLSEPFYELEAYRAEPPRDAIAFVGSPRKHPYDQEKIILISDPTGSESSVLEFRAGDIVHAKDLPSPVNADGDAYRVVMIWVRRGAVGLRYEPFEVDDPVRYLHAGHERILAAGRSGGREA